MRIILVILSPLLVFTFANASTTSEEFACEFGSDESDYDYEYTGPSLSHKICLVRHTESKNSKKEIKLQLRHYLIEKVSGSNQDKILEQSLVELEPDGFESRTIERELQAPNSTDLIKVKDTTHLGIVKIVSPQYAELLPAYDAITIEFTFGGELNDIKNTTDLASIPKLRLGYVYGDILPMDTKAKDFFGEAVTSKSPEHVKKISENPWCMISIDGTSAPFYLETDYLQAVPILTKFEFNKDGTLRFSTNSATDPNYTHISSIGAWKAGTKANTISNLMTKDVADVVTETARFETVNGKKRLKMSVSYDGTKYLTTYEECK